MQKNTYALLFSLFFLTTLTQAQTTTYQPPNFTDNNRAEKLAKYYPLVEKIYSEYATKNHFPGYAFGIVLDGKLVYSGAGGFTDMDKKIIIINKLIK